MRFLKNWQRFKRPPSDQLLLDTAIAITLLPHLFILKAPMLFYLLLSLLLLMTKKSSKWITSVVTLAGVAAIILSFFAEYNFASFSRMLVFVSFLISLLIFAIALQRFTRKINVYLLISPVLLLTLSFFYFNSITMLFYSLGALFLLVLLLLWQRMQASLREALRFTLMLFTFSLPIVALLFMVFPRISFKKAEFGFKDEVLKRTGHDGTMHLDERALLVPSQKVVMEVLFEEEIPPDPFLYFRGSALYIDKTNSWEILPIPARPKGSLPVKLSNTADVVKYDVTLYPHQKRWLYMLDMPIEKPEKSYRNPDMVIMSHETVSDIRRYPGVSALRYTLTLDDSAIFVEEALDTHPDRDPNIAQAVASLIKEEEPDRLKADKLLSYFKSLELTYTLRPQRLDIEHPVDSFLYGSKTGYCVHFAAAFATAARMAGIPARIITGFKAERSRGVNNYLVVVEADAHAWVELYIDQLGWMRYEPTATATRIETGYEGAIGQTATEHSLFQKLNLRYMYGKYLIETWILEYSRSKQLLLLKRLLEDTYFLLKFIGAALMLVLLSVAIFTVLKRAACKEPVMCRMDKLLRILEKKGLQRRAGETMKGYLDRAASELSKPKELEKISRLYHEARYSQNGDQTTISNLERAIRAFKASLS